jgi:hypothetical protein
MPKNKPAEKAHATLSASGSERWLQCPGSIALCKDIPDEPESRYAKEGTKAHELLEKWATFLRDRTSLGAYVIPKGYNKGMREGVKMAIEHLKKIYKRESLNELLIEEKVGLPHIGDDMWGTTDIGIVQHFDELQVWDYKHGSGHAVDVTWKNAHGIQCHNTQLLYYGMGLAYKHDYNFSRLRIGVIQPRALHDDGPIRSEVISMKQLRLYEDLFKKGVERVYKPNARRFAGDWCRWCKGKSVCPEYQNSANDEAAKEFDDVE